MMLRLLSIWCVGLCLALLVPAKAGASPFPTCGGEHQRACNLGDPRFYDNYFQACEYDLKSVSGVCVNEKRRVWAPRSAWLRWALWQQRYGVEGNEPLNLVTTISAHNAYSNFHQGFGADQANQLFSITDQLRMGARALELDPHWSGGQLRLCHWGLGDVCPQIWTRLLASSFDEIRNWLAANPDEVIFIKLDAHIGSRSAELIDMVNHYFGNTLYPRPADAGAWPTPLQMRAAGKQVLFAMRGVDITTGNTLWFHNSGYATGNDWPKDINFTTCTDGDGRVTYRRDRWRWSATAEGRSESNLFSQTGLINPATQNMRQLLNCGVSLIGLDFLDALDASTYFKSSAADDRIESSIWSFERGDYGNAGPALMRGATGRWTSRDAVAVHRFACSLPDTGNVWGRLLRVSSGASTWNRGADICRQEFGANASFSFPSSPYLNDQLFKLTGGADVWLNYSQVVQPDPLVQPARLVFRGAIGQPVSGAEFTVFGRPALGQLLAVKPEADSGWLSVTPLDGLVPLEQGNRFVVNVNAAAVPPVAQTYRAALAVGYSVGGATATVAVDYAVLRQAAVTLGYTNPEVRQPQGATAVVRLQSPLASLPLSGGVVSIREALPALPGAETAFRTLGTATLPPAAAQVTLNIPLRSTEVGVGRRQLFAVYSGGTNHSDSVSDAAPLTVTPRIQVVPAAVNFSMVSGGALPPPVQLKLGGLAGPPRLLKAPAWASGTVVDGEVVVRLNSGALQFGAGTFSDTLTIGDGAGVDTDVPITVAVQLPTGLLPSLYATSAGSRGRGAVPLRIVNGGRGVAAAAALASVTGIEVVSGTGTVSLPGTVPMPLGSLQPGASIDVALPLIWPATARRIRMTLQFTSNSGGYVGTQVLNLNR